MCFTPPRPPPPTLRTVMMASGCLFLLVSQDYRNEFLPFSLLFFSFLLVGCSSFFTVETSTSMQNSFSRHFLQLLFAVCSLHYKPTQRTSLNFYFYYCLLERFPFFVICDPARHFSPTQESFISPHCCSYRNPSLGLV